MTGCLDRSGDSGPPIAESGDLAVLLDVGGRADNRTPEFNRWEDVSLLATVVNIADYDVQTADTQPEDPGGYTIQVESPTGRTIEGGYGIRPHPTAYRTLESNEGWETNILFSQYLFAEGSEDFDAQTAEDGPYTVRVYLIPFKIYSNEASFSISSNADNNLP